MFRSLYSKLAAVLTGLFCLVGLSFVAVTLFSAEMYQQEANQRLNIHLAKHIVSEKLLIKEKRVNKEALGEIFHMLMVINPSIEIYLVDPEGRILAFSAPPGKVRRERVNVERIQKLLDGDVKIPFLGDDPRDPGGKKVFTAARIPEHGKLEGYLYVILGGEAYDSVVQKLKGSYILQLSAWIIAASLFFALAAGLILFALLTGRLKRLASVVGAYKMEGTQKLIDLPIKALQDKGDEIDRLASTFKKMAERIEDQMEKLRKSDALRSELIANVSHDLRTPLTVLQGQIDVLLMRRFIDEESRQSLERMASETRRLSRMTNNLLLSAQLESEPVLTPGEVDLRELLDDIAREARVLAEGLNLKVSIPEIIIVPGDYDLLKQMVLNVVDNAVKFTPKGGAVELTLGSDERYAVIEISDTGQGILPEHLSHITEPFYKAEASRKSGHSGAGLGLAIVKQVIDLHRGELHIGSREGAGTTVTLRLPLRLSPE